MVSPGKETYKEKFSGSSLPKSSIPPTPFVKWAGGKSQLLGAYRDFIPQVFNSYYEPFVGGGALFFALYRQKRITKAYLNDSNGELINLYLCLRDHLEELMEELKKHEAGKLSKKYYYEVRNLDRKGEAFARLTAVQRAARTLFLNKTCFNGLFRVNRKGHFNVPFGKNKNPSVLDEINLRAASRALQRATITCGDFLQALFSARRGDFIYFDPPYHPLSPTSSFTSYTEDGFSYEDQKRLAQAFRELDARGCLVMLSNSCAEAVLELYRGYRIEKLLAKRAINSQVAGRGPVPEIVVTNYEVRGAS